VDKIEEFKKIISQSNNIVFFGGAGVSTESNIPDFRGTTGLYNNNEEKYPAEYILSHDFFFANVEYFYKFYFSKMIYPNALPNDCHKVLAKMEALGKIKAVITQNIDGLHQKAGSKNVIELHGSVMRNYCTKCHKFYDLEYMLKFKDSVPKCNVCGSIIKPDVVLYQEGLNSNDLERALYYVSSAETLIVGGTSLTVYPAAGLIRYFKGKNIILINENSTPLDDNFGMIIKEKVGKVFKEIDL
jgi:NAD-dependent deacetylase